MAAAVALAVGSSCASGSCTTPSVASISRWRTASAGILQRASQPSTKQLSRHRPVSASRTCSLVTSASASQAAPGWPAPAPAGWPADLAVGHRGVVGVAHDQRLAQPLEAGPERLKHRTAAPGQSGAVTKASQVVWPDPGVVERLGLAGSEVEHRPDLPGTAVVGWDVGPGEDRAEIRVGSSPRLDGRPWPCPTAGRGEFGSREVDGGGGLLQDSMAG